MGDHITVQSLSDEFLRILGGECDEVNCCWLAERDRLSFEAIMSDQR